MILQVEITLKSKSRGFHLVTSEIVSQLPKLPKTGIVNIFTKHTSSLYFCEYRNYGGSLVGLELCPLAMQERL